MFMTKHTTTYNKIYNKIYKHINITTQYTNNILTLSFFGRKYNTLHTIIF